MDTTIIEAEETITDVISNLVICTPGTIGVSGRLCAQAHTQAERIYARLHGELGLRYELSLSATDPNTQLNTVLTCSNHNTVQLIPQLNHTKNTATDSRSALGAIVNWAKKIRREQVHPREKISVLVGVENEKMATLINETVATVLGRENAVPVIAQINAKIRLYINNNDTPRSMAVVFSFEEHQLTWTCVV